MLLGKQARFFCQMQSKYEDLRFRINGGVTTLSLQTPGITLTIENRTLGSDASMTVYSINITINATKKRNNTELECYDITLGRENTPSATLTILGWDM